MYRKNNGITLMVLVITVIVLLILASVSVAMLTGENGILTQAQNAKNETNKAAKNEQLDLAKQEDLINESLKGVNVEQVTDTNPGKLEVSELEKDTYIINSIEDLVFFACDVTSGNKYEGKTVKLGLNLDFNSTKSYVEPFRTDYGKYGYHGELKTLLTTGEGFKPIGTTYDTDVSTNYFCGIFDGGYNTIYNLYQNYEDSDNTTIIGLFSTNGGIINNLKIENCNMNFITNNMYVVSGVICGRNNGTINNCGTSGDFKMIDNGVKVTYASGIAGQSFGIIEKCYSKTNIEASINSSSSIQTNVGGIAATVSNDYIKSCYNAGEININLNADVETCVGGITALNNKKVENCYNMGKIELKSNIQTTKNIFIGNIIGNNNENAEINSCFNIGQINVNVLNDNDNIGIGSIIGDSYLGTINNCYNIGKINLENSTVQNIAQIVGRALSTTFSNCYGVIEENVGTIGYDRGNNIINNVTLQEKGKIPESLEIIGTDFENDSENINQGYPILDWQEKNK